MTRRFFIVAILFCFRIIVNAQSDTAVSNAVEQQLENITAATETENEDDSFIQSLLNFRTNKLNLNTADISDLRELRMLSDLQIQSLLTYRRFLGPLLTVYELQAVPAWDVQTIQRVLPFIVVSSTEPLYATIRQRLSGGNKTFLFRAQQVLEKSEGFSRPASMSNRYGGSRQRLFARYKYSYRNLLQYGITSDKDAGENFFKNNKGFDFYSFHFFARKLGAIKAVAIGDYTVNLGQGLIQWQSLAFKKGPDVMNVKRQSDVLRPYNSAGEYNFLRGAAFTFSRKNVDITLFASSRNIDANFEPGISPDVQPHITSILTSGYHRTPAELENKSVLRQQAVGANLQFNSNSLHIGFNAVAFKFSLPLIRNIQPYNQFAIQGNSWNNKSIDYSYTYKNLHFFGEAAIDKRGEKAFLNGLLLSLHHSVDASLLYRNISRSYQTLYGNAFTESTFPTNEKGMFAGITARPASSLRIDAYVDVFAFPWLRFRVDAPSDGFGYMVQVTYKPNKKIEMYSRYRNESKSINLSDLNLPTRVNVNRPKQDWRTNISYKINRSLTMRHRTELLWFDSKVKERSEQGWLTYFDAVLKPNLKPYSVTGRLQFFSTESYDSRIYAFENDVLYSFSIPAFYDKGLRYYVNFNCDITRNISAWLRWSQTIYSGKQSIGSALDEIPGNKKSEIKAQFFVVF